MKSPDFLKIARLSVLLLICSMISLPASWAQATASTTKSLSIREHNDKKQLTIKKNGFTFDVEINGYITLSDDDRDVIAISSGGYLKISKSAFGTKRRIQIEADRNGQLNRKYFVGWRERDYEPEGREWLAEILPEVVRSSSVGAEDRVNRIYNKGGMSALADEIRLLDGDYVKTTYLKLTMCKKLTDVELNQLVNLIGEEVESDHYLSELLMENYDLFIQTPARLEAYVSACRKIESDHYLTEVLSAAVTSNQVTDQQLANLLQAAQSIQSDHYLSALLIEVLESRDMSGSNLETLMSISRSIESDHYQAEVMTEALNSDRLSDTAFNRLLDNLGAIQSDHYATEVITDLLENSRLSEAVLVKVLTVVQDNIASDHYQAECLQSFLEQQRLNDATLAAFLGAVKSMGSDSYIANVMEEAADLDNLSDGQLIALLGACGNINSDHYLADSLAYFADDVNQRSATVKDAYRAAAKNINSESYYGKALRAIE